jgi:hypothetical protein
MAMIRFIELMVAALYALDRAVRAIAGSARRTRAALISWRRLLWLRADRAILSARHRE